MGQPFFSIIVVCLNPGKKLKNTLESIEKQSFRNFEVVIKDGGSSDGSLDDAYALKKAMEEEKHENEGEGQHRIKIVRKKDHGIYDAMNQAARETAGKFLYFLNCGDRFYSSTVLEEMWNFINHSGNGTGVYYGNIYERRTRQTVASNPCIDAFGCYRNVPCHQACFYERRLVLEHPFETRYRVRADYEQFLWCFFGYGGKDKMVFAYKDMIVADYEGDGFSEAEENRKVSRKEHKEITKRYMSKGQLFKFRLVMIFTLAPLRTWIAQNEKTAGIYNRLKEMMYARKRHQ